MAAVSIAPDRDLLSEDLTHDPYPYLAALREAEPIHWNSRHRAWFVTRYDDVRFLLRDRRLSSDAMTPYFQRRLSVDERDKMRHTIELLRLWMIYTDGPDHRRLRSVVQNAFGPDRMERLREFSTDVSRHAVSELMQRAETQPGRPLDLISGYADRLPGVTILELIGIPAEDRTTFAGWAELLGSLINGFVSDPHRAERADQGVSAMVRYLDKLIDDTEPRPDGPLLGALLHAESEGERLTRTEVMATCVLLLDAGFKNTVRLISAGLKYLIEQPSLLQKLQGDRDLLAPFIEEVLRLEGPGKFLVRWTGDSFEYAGTRFGQEQRLFLSTAAANRDPVVFDRPDKIHLHRDPNPHLAFGHGLHGCIGAPLSRLQGVVALDGILDCLTPETSLASPATWQAGLLSRSLAHLAVDPTSLRGPKDDQ